MNTLEEIETDYRVRKHDYERLLNCIEMNLKTLFRKRALEIHIIESRIKTVDSLISKIQRKRYSKPLEQLEDICGLRVICYYVSDLKIIDEIIADNFNVLNRSYKEVELGEEKFGYRSNHYIVSLKSEWCILPTNENLENYKAEIQVRTILMHAWADISHKLNYKEEDDSPKQLKRKLNQLSALFEIADNYFVDLNEMKQKYLAERIGKLSSSSNDYLEENVDSLKALLDYYFPERESNDNETGVLFNEMKEYDITILDLQEYIKKITLEDLLTIEQEESKLAFTEVCWVQVGVARTILELCNDIYFADRKKSPYSVITESWRNKIAARTSTEVYNA